MGHESEASKARLDVPSPSNFIIVLTVMDHLIVTETKTGRVNRHLVKSKLN